MKKVYWQLVFKEWGRMDDEFNEATSQEIFETELDAWKYAMLDCANDEDIAFLMKQISSGIISTRRLVAPEYNCDDCDKLIKKPCPEPQTQFYRVKSVFQIDSFRELIFLNTGDAYRWLEDQWDAGIFGDLDTAIDKKFIEILPVDVYTNYEEERKAK